MYRIALIACLIAAACGSARAECPYDFNYDRMERIGVTMAQVETMKTNVAGQVLAAIVQRCGNPTCRCNINDANVAASEEMVALGWYVRKAVPVPHVEPEPAAEDSDGEHSLLKPHAAEHDGHAGIGWDGWGGSRFGPRFVVE